MVAAQGKSGVVDDVAQHRPGVGDDGDTVLAKLGSESVGLQPTGQRDAGAADYGSAEADQQRGLVVQRCQAIHRVGAAQGGRRGGTEGGKGPPVIGDLLGDELPAGGAERDERQVPRIPRVGSIPRRELDGIGIDLFHVDDAGVLGQMQIRGLTTSRAPVSVGAIAARSRDWWGR